MQAIRQFYKPKNGMITVQLPQDFVAEEVEVIVLPKSAAVNGAHKDDESTQAIQTFLLMDTSNFTVEQLYG